MSYVLQAHLTPLQHTLLHFGHHGTADHMAIAFFDSNRARVYLNQEADSELSYDVNSGVCQKTDMQSWYWSLCGGCEMDLAFNLL